MNDENCRSDKERMKNHFDFSYIEIRFRSALHWQGASSIRVLILIIMVPTTYIWQ